MAALSLSYHLSILVHSPWFLMPFSEMLFYLPFLLLLFAHSHLSLFLPKPLPIRVISHLPNVVVTSWASSRLLCRTRIIACPIPLQKRLLFALFFSLLSSLSVVGSLSPGHFGVAHSGLFSVPQSLISISLLCRQPSLGIYAPDLSPEPHACIFKHPPGSFPWVHTKENTIPQMQQTWNRAAVFCSSCHLW